MKKWNKSIIRIVSFLVLTMLMVPVGAAAAEAPDVSPSETEETKPAFQNPDGMLVDFVYIYIDADGSEQIAATVKRVIVPAGTVVITADVQKELLPEGYELKDPKDLPLDEDTLSVKITVVPAVPEATEPSEKPEEPSVPDEKPQDPTEKPENPTEKPQKPADKPAKPDPTNPQTGDSRVLYLWISAAFLSGILLLIQLRTAVIRRQ